MPVQRGPRLVARISSFDHPKTDLPGFFRSHPLNCAIQICFPAGGAAASVACDAMRSNLSDAFYYAIRCNAGLFSDAAFVESHVKGAQLYAISAATPLDRTDTVAITPDGKMHLSVTKDTFQQLGLPGKESLYCKGMHRFIQVPSFLQYMPFIQDQLPGSYL